MTARLVGTLPLLLPLVGCDPGPEPLDLPADPAERGVPVGVRTVEANGVTMEVWYPAPDDVEGSPTDPVQLGDFIPASVTDRIGAVEIPPIDSGAVRDAPVRLPEEPYPVLLFSHGFGAFRSQSVTWTVHLASRGYVVVGVDHPGRMLADVLPCVFSPPAEGCAMSFDEDPAEDDLPAALDWVVSAAAEGDFAGVLDTSTFGLSGHSMGGNSTATVGSADPRFGALFAMASNLPASGAVPTVFSGGTCDGAVPIGETEGAFDGTPGSTLVAITGVGHMGYTDLCDLDLVGLAETSFAGRDDVSEVVLDMLKDLASDGCPGVVPPADLPECAAGYLDLKTSNRILLSYGTSFFDGALKGLGDGIQPGLFPEAEVR